MNQKQSLVEAGASYRTRVNDPVVRALAIAGILAFWLVLIAARMPPPSTYSNPSRISSGAGVVAHSEEKRKTEVKQRFEQGVAMLQIGQYEHAVTAFHRVLTLNPMMPEAHVNMGFAFYELGDFLGAERFFRGALALNSAVHNAHYGLSISLYAQGKTAEARLEMQSYLDVINETDPFYLKALAKLREIDGALETGKGLGALDDPSHRSRSSATDLGTSR